MQFIVNEYIDCVLCATKVKGRLRWFVLQVEEEWLVRVNEPGTVEVVLGVVMMQRSVDDLALFVRE